MRQIKKSIQIHAPKEKVWDVLLGTDTYPVWAAAFMEGSTAVTDWHEGGTALFLDPSGSGMASRITSHVIADHIIIEHLGIVGGGQEDYDSKEAREWRGANESYFVSEHDGITTLIIESDMPEAYYDMLDKSWDKALLIVKELSEKAH